MNGTVKELKVLVQDLVNNVVEKSRFIRLLNRLDSINTKTSLKSLTLPGSNFFESNTESKTPRRCSVDGTTVDRLRSGTCVISYTITSSDGTGFTTEKKIRFKQ